MKASSDEVKAALIAAIVTGIFSLITAVTIEKIKNDTPKYGTPLPPPPPTLTQVKWDDSIFNSSDGLVEFTLKKEPLYEPLRQRIEWIVDANCVGDQFCFLNWGNDFQAIFKDNDGITLKKVNLTKTGKSFPQKIILFIPDDVWSKWSQVATVEIKKCAACLD